MCGEGDGHAQQHGVVVPNFLEDFWVVIRWHGHVRGHELVVPKFFLGVLNSFGFFVEFLGFTLVGNYVWPILGKRDFVEKVNVDF